jgi:flagellar hook-length control protein FliK
MIHEVVARETDLTNASHFLRTTSASGQSFDHFMAALETRERPEPRERERATDRSIQRDSVRESAATNDRRNPSDRPRAENRSRPANSRETQEPADTAVVDMQAAAETAAVYAVAETAEVVAMHYPGEKQAAMIMEALSQALQISPELLKQMLNDLGLKLEDLANMQETNLFMQKLMGKNALELLNMPEYPEMLKALTEGVEKALETPVAEVAVSPAFAVLSELKVTVDADNQLVVEALGEEYAMVHADEEMELSQQGGGSSNSGAGTQGQQQTVATEAAVTQVSEGEGFIVQDSTPTDQPQISPLGMQTESVAAKVAKAAAMPVQADPVKVMEQIVNSIKVMPSHNYSEIRLLLKPESLGEVALRIATINGIVTAMFVAENMRVKEIIESNFNQLRDSLQGQGIEVSQLSVSVGHGGEAEERMNQFLKAQQESIRRAQRIAAGAVGGAEEEAVDEPAPISDGRSTVDFSA